MSQIDQNTQGEEGVEGTPTNGGPDAPAEGTPPSVRLVDEEIPKEAFDEVQSFLGQQVKSPVGIPKDYSPLDSSGHEIFRVELSDFAGPLDLLLYLIRRHDLDIFDIPIAFITEKYLEMLKALQALPIDVAADFLVTAAELLHIKSKMLLPSQAGVAVEEEPEEEGDPREELVRRLLEYQKYRDAADQLGDRDRLGRDVFARLPPRLDAADDLDPGMKSVSVFRLVELMAGLMKKIPAHHEITFDTFNISERIVYVTGFGETRGGRFTLVQILQGIVSRAELVGTFIAVLEMAKAGLVRITLEDAMRSMRPQKEAASAPDAHPRPEESLPTIWIELTGKELEGDLVEDYR